MNNFQIRTGYGSGCWAQYLLKKKNKWFLGKKKNKPLKVFADFNLCMKMRKTVFNFLMETCFPPEEICGINLILLEQRQSS